MQRFLLPFRKRRKDKFISPTALLIQIIVSLSMILISNSYLDIFLCYALSVLFFLALGGSIKRSFPLVIAASIIIFFLGLPSLFLRGSQLMYHFWKFDIYEIGINKALRIWLRGITSVSLVTLYSTTITIQEFIYSLKSIFLPSTMIMIIILILRYTPLFCDQANQIHIAQQLRGIKIASRKRKFSAAAALVGGTLIRSMKYGEEVYEAMTLRGMKDLSFIKHDKIKFADAPILLLFTVVLSLIGGGVLNAS